MNKLFYNASSIFFFLLYSCMANSQANSIDSLKIDSFQKVLQTQKEDTNKVNTLLGLSDQYWTNNDHSHILQYSRAALALSEKINFTTGKFKSYLKVSWFFFFQNDRNSEAFTNGMAALKMAQRIGNKKDIADCYDLISL